MNIKYLVMRDPNPLGEDPIPHTHRVVDHQEGADNLAAALQEATGRRAWVEAWVAATVQDRLAEADDAA